MNLYEISNDLAEVERLIDTGDASEVATEILDTLKEVLSNKADGVAKYILNEETNIKQIDEEIKRLKELKDSKNKRLDNFKDYVITSIQITGKKKIETTVGNLSIRNYPIIKISVEEKDIPDIFKNTVVKEVTSVDKTALKKAIKNGEEIKGVDLQDNYKVAIK